MENVHRDGILRVSTAPAPDVTPELQARAERHALAVMERLGHVGVLAIELFAVGDGLLANEMAPRVHNSGHWTIEGAATSQFENHLRAICGLELGPTPPFGLQRHGEPDRLGSRRKAPSTRLAGVHLHLYGKASRPGRKLGHVTVIGPDPDTRDRVLGRVTQTADNH